jgi:hypothetical protein
LSQDSTDVLVLLVEVTRAQEAAAAMEAARFMMMLAEEIFAREATTALYITVLHVKNAEGRATLAETEALYF